jgi:hypothetical protein
MAAELPVMDQECFFIAPIGAEGSKERERSDGVLDFIVAKAAEELGLVAVRADRLGEPGQITLQVIAHVLGARAAVVDLTGANPNVYYELAIRHTASLPTVLIAEETEKLPFDIAQMRTVFFDHENLRSADRCRQDIVTQLQRALSGAVDSPVRASVDIKSLQAGSSIDRTVAELATTMETVTSVTNETQRMLRQLVERRHTRVLSGDWSRVMTRRNTLWARAKESDDLALLRFLDLFLRDLEDLAVASQVGSEARWMHRRNERAIHLRDRIEPDRDAAAHLDAAPTD